MENRTLLIIGILVVVVVGAGLAFMMTPNQNNTTNNSTANITTTTTHTDNAINTSSNESRKNGTNVSGQNRLPRPIPDVINPTANPSGEFRVVNTAVKTVPHARHRNTNRISDSGVNQHNQWNVYGKLR